MGSMLLMIYTVVNLHATRIIFLLKLQKSAFLVNSHPILGVEIHFALTYTCCVCVCVCVYIPYDLRISINGLGFDKSKLSQLLSR